MFSEAVILPAYLDAVALAKAADAKSIIDNLGDAQVFFEDIARAKLSQWDSLQTVGALEWAVLKATNELMLPLLPQFTDQPEHQ